MDDMTKTKKTKTKAKSEAEEAKLAEIVACPRCEGTGTWTLENVDGPPEEGFSVSEVCRPCCGTGRVTKRRWKEWLDMWEVKHTNPGPSADQIRRSRYSAPWLHDHPDFRKNLNKAAKAEKDSKPAAKPEPPKRKPPEPGFLF